MSLDEFDVKNAPEIEPSKLDQEFERFYHNTMPHLTSQQAQMLMARIGTLELLDLSESEVVYGANFDMTVEVEGLIQSVRAMRSTVMTPGGTVRNDVTPREMKEVVTATSTLMTLLMKSHEKLMSFDRQRRLEQTTIEVLQRLSDGNLRDKSGEEIVAEFVTLMEQGLDE
ncbi:MAG: hypothetical protein C0610_16785 [Desulfobacteraceae bacterium]|nr:MAG: hypothetical protein C0610_16785 [Desulfobacteraceae bacterium]